MKKIKLVVFDLDGTLIDTVDEITDAVNDMLRTENKEVTNAKVIRQLIGRGMKQLFIDIVSGVHGLSPEEVEKYDNLEEKVRIFDDFYLARTATNSRLYPKVRETLEILSQKKMHLSLVTNKKSTHTDKILQAFDLKKYFSPIIASNTFVTCKPDPLGVRTCMEQYGVTAEETIFVGDSEVDVSTAKNAGTPIWALPYGYTAAGSISAAKPDRIIEDISALLELTGD